MYKKALGISLMGTLFCFCSCVDDTYDLNKGIETDVKIQGNELAMPLGSLQAIKLESLLSTEDNEMLSLMDGIYGISMQEEIEPFTVELGDITLSLDPFSYSTGFNFQDLELQDVHVDGMEKVFDMSTITDFSLEKLNEELPLLHADHALHLTTGHSEFEATVKEAIEKAGKLGLDAVAVPLPTDHTVTIEEEIACTLSYELPQEIKSVNTIILADIKAESQDGILLEFHLDHPTYIRSKEVDKKLTFEATFPEMFKLSPPNNPYYSIVDNTVRIKDMPVGDEGAVLQVLLEEITDIPHKDGHIFCDQPIVYTLTYVLNGNMTVDKHTDLGSIEIGIDVDTQLGCRDAIGETNPITFDFETQEFDFPIEFGGIEYISRINYVDFDASKSIVSFETSMEHGFDPLKLDENSYVELVIPHQIVLDESLSSIPEGATYDAETHAFRIYNELEALYNKRWELAVDRIDVNEDITEGTLNIDDCKVVIKPSNEEGVTFEGTTVSLSQALEKLEGEVKITLDPVDLHIEDASITTDRIEADIEEVTSFELNEPIDKGIGRIKRVGFEQPVALDLQMNLAGLADDVDIKANIDLNITLPSFLSLTSKDKDIEVDENNVLKINKHYETGKPLSLSLEVNALDFSTMEGGYLAPKDSADGNSYLQYASDIKFAGKIIAESAQLNFDLLESEIQLDAELSIGDIKIKELVGLYQGEIEPIEGSIPVGLDEELDIFGQENTIKLSRPQIMVEFENPINIGLTLDLLVKSNDDKELIKKDAIKINAAHYDEESGQITPNVTKLLITNKDVQLDDYQTILMPEVSDLLADMPDSISYSLTPRIVTTEDQHIDLTQPFSFSGKYAVAVPFLFDELNFTYSDTISDIEIEMEEVTEMLAISKLALSMNINNTIPFELTLSPIALDENGDRIGIELTEITLPAGNGQALDPDAEGKPVHISLSGDMNEISRLAQIAFTVKLQGSSETVGGIALRPEQGIHITKLAITVAGDIEFDFAEMDSEEE